MTILKCGIFKKLNALFNANWNVNLYAVQHSSLIPNSVSDAIAHDNFKEWHDEEVIPLHYPILEEEPHG